MCKVSDDKLKEVVGGAQYVTDSWTCEECGEEFNPLKAERQIQEFKKDGVVTRIVVIFKCPHCQCWQQVY